MKRISIILPVMLLFWGCISNSPETLKYNIIEEKDISFMGVKRGTVKAIVESDTIPSEELLKSTSREIWKPVKHQWDEYTVWLYLEGTQINSVAYSTADFEGDNLERFVTSEASLLGTKWEDRPPKQ